jgi:Hemolysin-type calcium-binding repeat (2 copies)./FG-GAP repeat.
VANSGSGNVSILLNTTTYTTSIATTPTFATKVDFTTGTKPYSVSIGDFNGDGKPDLAVANGGDDTASIFLNGVIPKVTAVTATTPDGSYGVDSTIAITVTFDAAVTVTGTPQLQLETGATDQFATYASGTGGTALTFNYVVKAGDTSADLQYLSTTALTPNGGTIKDSLAVDVDAVLTLPALASANSLGGSKAIVVDGVAPTVTLTSTSAATVNGLFNVTATFSENVSNFINTDITVANGNVSNFATVDAKTYTFDVTPTADGNVTVDIPAAKATDIAGNNNTAANQLTRTADITAPTVSLTSPSTPTVNGLFTVTATFSENVSNFINTDITVANGNVSNFTTVDAKTYTFDVTPTADGNVTVDIPAAKATDTAGNNNTAAPQLSRTANITPPTVTLTSPSAATVTGLFSVTATFTEDVIGFDNTDITVANATASNFVKVDAKTYTFDVTPTASGNVTVDIPAAKATDIAGNNNTAAIQLTRTADVTAPTANLGAISNITTAGGTSQTLTVTFSDNNAVDVSSLDSSDVLINWSGGDIPAQFVSVDTNSNGTPRTATYSFIPPGGSWDDTDNATYTVKLQGSQVKDALGNLNAATSLGTFNVNVAVPKPIPIPLVTPSVTTTPTPRTIIINTPSVGNIDRGQPTNYPQNQVVDNQYLLSDEDDTSIPQSAFGQPIFGLSGNDKLTGSADNDTIYGNNGADTIDGGDGNDNLFGGKKSDQLSGGNGNDFLSANNDNDTVTGGDGNDILRGGKENDVLIGGNGDDELWGDRGFDVLTGGAGKDTFVLQYTANNPSQADVITDFTSDDKIKLIGVNFTQLTFESVNIILDGANAVSSTAIKSGNNYLGVVYNVNQTALNSGSFL